MIKLRLATHITTLLAAALATALAAACKDRKPAGAPPPVRDAASPDGGTAPAPADAAGVGDIDEPDPDGPDEATLRQGRRTGLAAPDEKPEVLTEELIEALVAGTIPWSRWIDPARGVVQLALPAETAGPVARRCGAALTAALDALTATMRSAAADTLGYTLDCDNHGLFAPDPGGAQPAAACSLESPAPDTLIIDLVFVPDPTRGLRLVGISTVPADADPGAAVADFEAAMAHADACP